MQRREHDSDCWWNPYRWVVTSSSASGPHSDEHGWVVLCTECEVRGGAVPRRGGDRYRRADRALAIAVPHSDGNIAQGEIFSYRIRGI